VAKHESLVIGLLLVIQKGAKILHVHGDSNIVIGQVCKRYTCHDKRLGHYRNRVWDLIESFDDFNVKRISQTRNLVVKSLAQFETSLEPLAMDCVKKCMIELTSVPSVFENITNFQVFEDDKHILDFLASSRVFEAQVIDEGEQQQAQFEIDEIMNLRTNTIPK
jgi:hypothetical protein